MKFTLPELTEIGERIFNLKRLFNVRCGITRADDRIPPRLQTPLSEGLVKNKSLTIDAMLEAYYKYRGWDQDGIPTKNKLIELQISEY
jgi:aldehyde:ferredoxin oxidoreductase